MRRQPAVGARRPQVELGAEAVQRAPGRRDPARIGMAGVEDRLLGVRAEAADDEERDAVGARGALHAIEGARDVGAHALALALRERAVVAASRVGRLPRRRELRLGARRDRRGPSRLPGPDLEAVTHRHPHPRRRERVRVGERHARVARAVGLRDAVRRRASEREVRRLRQMARAGPGAVGVDRLEQPRVRVVHRPRAGQRGEVRRPLRPRLPPTPARDEPEHERPEDERHEPADHEHRRLTRLGARSLAPAGSTRRCHAAPRHAALITPAPPRATAPTPPSPPGARPGCRAGAGRRPVPRGAAGRRA